MQNLKKLEIRKNMTHLQIFQPDEKAVALAGASSAIVNTLSDNYREIIGRMVGKSENTKKTYTRNVEHFLAYIQRHGIDAHTFGQYRNALDDVEVATKTKNAYLAAAGALLRESLKYGILPVDITANVPAFKTTRGHVKDGLSESEVARVAAYITGMENAATRRKMAAMFNLLALEGLRQMEVQQLRVEDVNLKDGYIRIRGKGKHEREKFYIMAATVSAIREYVEDAGVASGWLFPSSRSAGAPITLRAIRKYFTCPKYGIFARCGIDGKSVHGFRHFNITHTLKKTNGNIAFTRRRSRHAGTEMLVVYDDERLSKADVEGLEDGFTSVAL